MRGEHRSTRRRAEWIDGSSPRARGTLRGPWWLWPDCAGHPRVRGEHFPPPVPSLAAIGSSPRARGTPRPTRPLARSSRVIPACAGNTAWTRASCTGRTGHPRVRGEHLRPPTPCVRKPGSSPRARGTRRTATAVSPGQAGHPRVRGEHSASAAATCGAYGSSPRARGTRSHRRRRLQLLRVIPACAGNTGDDAPGHREVAGHPRVRGEHSLATYNLGVQPGSSPRARGTRSGAAFPPGRPAGHPRVRGEHS